MFKDKKYIIVGIITLVLAVGIVSVKAADRIASVTINNVENLTMNVEGSVDGVGDMLGGGTRFPNGISADSTSPSAGEVRGTTLTTTGAATVGGDLTITGDLNKTGATLDASTSLTVALTLTAAQVCDNSMITVTPGASAAASLDITLPATSTLFSDCMSTEGDERSFWICNESATAASTTQIVAGTGIKLVEPDGQNVEIGGGACAKVNMVRALLSGTENAVVSVDELINAD